MHGTTRHTDRLQGDAAGTNAQNRPARKHAGDELVQQHQRHHRDEDGA